MTHGVSLCKPESKRYAGGAFKPSRAVPVDMFPHTNHVEFLIEFVRE
jgi:tRNA (uracil-5-)-methyltransferase